MNEATAMDVLPFRNFVDPAASEAVFVEALANFSDTGAELTLQTQIARASKPPSRRVRLGRAADFRKARWVIARTLRSMRRPAEAPTNLRRLAAEAATQPDGHVFDEIGDKLLRSNTTRRTALCREARALIATDTSLDRPGEERLARLQRRGRQGRAAATIATEHHSGAKETR